MNRSTAARARWSPSRGLREDLGDGLLVQRVQRLVRGRQQCLRGDLAAQQVQRADLAGRPAVAPVQPPADQRTGAGAQPGQHEHDVVGLGRRALPVLGDRRRVGVVLDQHRALEGAAQPLAERAARSTRAARSPAVRCRRPRRSRAWPTPDGPQRAARDPGPAQQIGAPPVAAVPGARPRRPSRRRPWTCAPMIRPSRSDSSAATRCDPISTPSRCPASARNRNRRAGRPCRRATLSSARLLDDVARPR